MTSSIEVAETTAHANTIFNAVTAGVDLTLPTIDIAGYTPPNPVGNPLYTSPEALTVGKLTSGTIAGTGVFDVLMRALDAHFDSQHKKGRITGADYANAYVAATNGAMTTAVQFLLSKDQSYWQSQLIQMQARVAEANAIVAALQVEETRANVINARSQALMTQANYALAKMKLATEAVQIEQLEAIVTKVTYENTNFLPKQSTQLDNQNLLLSGQISDITAKKDQTLYETANILVAQNLGLTHDNAIKAYQLATVLPGQVFSTAEETRAKTYTRDFILPATLDNLNEQIEGNRAKTLNTRRDGTTVTGSVGVQKDLQNEQIVSYRRDAETKATKMLLDTWMLQASTNEAVIAPTSLNDAAINSMMTTLRANLSI